MKVSSLVLFMMLFSLMSCYSPYKGFDGVDEKGMGRTPPSMKLSESYDKDLKKMDRKMKRMMKKRRKVMGTPVEKDKEKSLSPF